MAQATNDVRKERLERALEELRRRFGEWVVYRLRDSRPSLGEKVVTTGSLGLDRVIGIGGVPRGRITELYGLPTSGKSTLAAHILANGQRNGGFVALIDADHAADLDRLRVCGVDLTDLLLAVPESPREALDIASLLAASGGLDALVIASTNGLVQGPRGDGRAFPVGLRRLVVELGASPTAAIFLTHLDRSWRPSGNAARALAHASSVRIACTPLEILTHDSGEALGIRLQAQVTKNKLAPPCGVTELEILRDSGIHDGAELFDLGVTENLISRGPLGYLFGDVWLGKGRESSIRALDNDPELLSQLREALSTEGR